MHITRIEECGELLMKRQLTIAFAESATAGRLCAEFSMVKDSGKFFKGGLVCYDACLKQEILGVSPELIKRHTPESREVTEALAKSLPILIASDIQVAVTGLTTEGGSETPEKPVGTMFIHIIIKGRSIAVEKKFEGSPECIIMQTAEEVANIMIAAIKSID